jgi:hypothetical protein
MRRKGRIVVAVCAAAPIVSHLSRPAPADAANVVSTWNAATSLWSSTNWTNVPAGAGFPNNGNAGIATYDAVINSGQVTLDLNVTLQNLTLGGGTLTGGNALVANEPFTWTGGTLSGTGTLTAGGGMSIGNNTHTFIERTINNPGTANWSGGAISSGLGAMFNNSGTFLIVGTSNWNSNQGGNAVTFNNTGTVTKTTGAGAASLGIVFNNVGPAGVVNVNAGTLSVAGGGSASGSFVLAPNTVLNFTNDYSLENGAAISGNGTARVSGGTVAVNGAVSVSRFELAAGTLTGPGNLTISSAMDWTGGMMSGDGSIHVPPSAVLNLKGNTKTLRRSVANSGTANWSSGGINVGQGSAFNNTGTFVNTFGGTYGFNQGGGTPVFNNFGVFQKSGAGESTNLALNFNNMGTVRVDAGTLLLSAQGSATGRFEIASGATLDFNSGAGQYVLNAGATITGGGPARIVSGGTLDVAGTVSVDRLEQAGALQGVGTLLVNHSYAWTGGLMTGVGTTLLAPGANGTWTGGIKTMSGGRAFDNAGNLSWEGGGVNAGLGVVLNNAGTFTVAAPGNVAFGLNQGGTQAIVNNTGRFVKAGGTSVAEIGGAFNNSGTTQVNLGVLQLSGGGTSGGRFEIAAGAELRLSSTTFDFAPASSAITGDGTFRASAGVTSVGGAYDVATTAIDGAMLNFSAGPMPNAHTLVTRQILFNSIGSRLNLSNNSAIIDYAATSPLPSIKSKLASGYANGQWDGNGIQSTSAAQQSGTGIGYAEASALLGIGGTQTASFNGRTVDATSLLLKFTLAGDANLDGAVNFVDLVALAQNYNTLDGSAVWTRGDFSYDGMVDFTDLVKLAQNYNQSLPVTPIPGAPTGFADDLTQAFAQVPEPGACPLTLLAWGLAARRGRRSGACRLSTA